MNDEQRQLALKSLQEDIDNLKKYNVNYDKELQEIDEAIRSLEETKVGFTKQIDHNNALVDAFEAAIKALS